MFYEYALEPAVLSSWERVRYFLDAFGPWKGRFLAEYPRKWKRMVWDALDAAGCPNVEKSRIEVRLRQLDRRVLSPRANAVYDPEKPWLDNALAEHAREPFRAIIARAAQSGVDHVREANEIDDRDDLWRVDQGGLYTRDPAVIVKAIAVLLAASSRVLLIDPYFRADQGDKLRALTELCAAVASRGVPVDVHFTDKERGYGLLMSDAARVLPAVVPTSLKVTLHCWSERTGGARFHNRFLLTDIGGVQFGDSIERGDLGQEDRVSIVEEASRLALWNHYAGPSPAFDAAGSPVEFIGGGSHGQRRR